MGKLLTKGRKLVKREPVSNAITSSCTISSQPAPLSPPPEPQTPTKRKRMSEFDDFTTTNCIDDVSIDPEFGQDASLITPPSTPSVYTLAKALFQRSSNTKIYGRQKERETIAKFLAPLIKTKNSHGALYLSGVPGTGKSALLNETLDKIARIEPHVHLASINCMIVDKPELIYSRIYHALVEDNRRRLKRSRHDSYENPSGETAGEDSDDNAEHSGSVSSSTKMIQKLDRLFVQENACHIVVLDELDHVMTKDQEVLFRIFQWAFMAKSNLILIGIANALDLTDRFLPRLRANSLTPQLLGFAPYTAEEIQFIIEQKLRGLAGTMDGDLPLMHPSAVSLVAKKTAAYTGDIRKAMDICRRAIEMVEEGARLKSAEQDGQYRNTFSQLTYSSAPRASVIQVSRICSTAFGGSTVTRIRQLNLQQKAVLCVLVNVERQAITAEIVFSNLTIAKLYEHYVRVSAREKLLQKLTLNEFFEVVSVLESAGVVSVAGICGRKGLGSSGSRKRTSRGGSGAGASSSSLGSRDEYGNRRVVSSVHIMDLSTAIGDIPVLRAYVI